MLHILHTKARGNSSAVPVKAILPPASLPLSLSSLGMKLIPLTLPVGVPEWPAVTGVACPYLAD